MAEQAVNQASAVPNPDFVRTVAEKVVAAMKDQLLEIVLEAQGDDIPKTRVRMSEAAAWVLEQKTILPPELRMMLSSITSTLDDVVGAMVDDLEKQQ